MRCCYCAQTVEAIPNLESKIGSFKLLDFFCFLNELHRWEDDDIFWIIWSYVCLLSLCKHSFTSLSGSAMEKHVHVAFLIQLHFSCRCSFSAFYIQILCIWKLLATQWLQKQLPTTIVKYQNKGGQNQLFVLNSDISELCFPFCTDESSLLICIKLITPLWSHVVAKPNEKIQWWVLLFMSNVICALSSGGFQ